MNTTSPNAPVASAAQIREAAVFADLAAQAMQRADDLTSGRPEPDRGTHALAVVCAAAIEHDDELGLDRGTDWTDHLLDMG